MRSLMKKLAVIILMGAMLLPLRRHQTAFEQDRGINSTHFVGGVSDSLLVAVVAYFLPPARSGFQTMYTQAQFREKAPPILVDGKKQQRVFPQARRFPSPSVP